MPKRPGVSYPTQANMLSSLQQVYELLKALQLEMDQIRAAVTRLGGRIDG